MPIVRKSIFKGFDFNTAIKKLLPLHQLVGSNKLIDLCALLIPEDQKATLFAICFDILVSDGQLMKEEQGITEYLQQSLNFESEIATKIIEVALIRIKWDSIITEN